MYLQSSLALTVAALSGLLVPLDAEAAPLNEGSRIEIEVTQTEVRSLSDRYSMYFMAGEGGEGAEGGEGGEGGEGEESCEGGEGGEGGEGEESCEEEHSEEEGDGDG